MRLIDADKLKHDLIVAVYSANNPKGVAEVIKIVEDQPTAYDVKALEQQRQVEGMNNITNIIDWIKKYTMPNCKRCNHKGTEQCDIGYCRCESQALETALAALEKQIVKKPVIERKKYSQDEFCICGARLLSRDETGIFEGKEENYCPNCGQRLKWE